jgi:hypothetical protein
MATPLARGYAYSGSAKNRLSYGQVKQLAQAFGLPGDAIAQIAKGESSLYADVQQRDPGDAMVGYGLLQMTPNAWGKGSAAYKKMQSLGGIEAMSDPVKNMEMARFLYSAAGNKLSPWYGTRFLTNRSGEGSLGAVNRALIPAALRAEGGLRASAASVDEEGPRTRTVTTTTPGIDNRQARAQLILSFLGKKDSDPVDFAVQARALRDVPATTTSREVPIGGRSVVGGAGAPGGDLAAMADYRASAIDKQQLPYQWGGGHQGQTPLGKAVPLDCSGAVSKVLGIDPRVADQFKTWGRPGDGGGKGVTVYSKPSHVLMKINGQFFGTSASNPGGGAGWIPEDQISPEYLSGFTARHSNR